MKTSIIIVIGMAICSLLVLVVVPLNKPKIWSSVKIGDNRASVNALLGKEAYSDIEANYYFWESRSINGQWVLVGRFDDSGNGKLAIGWYSFHNWFYDSDYNPMPRPYWPCNITTISIK